MTIVYLPPIGLNSECWCRCELDGVRAEYPDRRTSTPPAEAAGTADLSGIADSVAASCDGPLDLVCLSIGAAVGQYVALRHPDRVRSMMLACSGPGDRPRPDHAEQVLRAGMTGTLDSTLIRWFTPAALRQPNHPGVTIARRQWLRADPGAVAALWMAPRDLLTAQAVNSIRIPVTVLAGREDAAVPASASWQLYTRLLVSRFEVIAGPHMLPLECPADFTSAIRRHLSWAGAAS